MDIIKDAEQYKLMMESEASRFNSYFNFEYKKLYPEPIIEMVGLDWRFWGSLTTSVSLVVVAAFRTAQMFFATEVISAAVWLGESGNGTDMIAFVSSFFVLVGVEGGLAFISAVKTYNSGKVSEDVFKWQVGILLAISVMAGLGQSIGLIDNISEEVMKWFSYVLLFVMGAGTSVGAWLSGEIIGGLLRQFADVKEKAVSEFKAKKEEYLASARRLWEQHVLSEQTELTERAERERNEQLAEKRRAERRERREQGDAPKEKALTQKQIVLFEELEMYHQDAVSKGLKEMIGPTELLARLQEKYPLMGFAAKGYISEQRKIWIENHPEYFEETTL